MNDERLYINGQKIDLPIGQPIAKTLQVNDIGNLANRQSNFTRTVNLPKTPNNINSLNYLGVVGSDSNLPYQKNSAMYFVGNECLIYDGWANITETTDTYKTVIYDGIVDFYKAIENKNLSQVGLSDLNHSKTIQTIIDSWDDNSIFRYNIADYNGKTIFKLSGSSEEIINVDYLIPSARVKFIWDKIFETFGYTYSGDVFQTQSFNNLWLTYPKPVPTLVPAKHLINEQQFTPSAYTYTYFDGSVLLTGTTWISWLFNQPFSATSAQVIDAGSTTTSFGDVIPNMTKIDILENGTYSIDISGTPSTSNIDFYQRRLGSIINTGSLSANTTGFTGIIDCLSGDTLTVLMLSPTPNFSFNQRLSKVEGFDVSFDEALIDFSIKDFINEIMQRYSLTMFADNANKTLTFLTTDEWLKTNEIVDWSNKNPKLLKTTYTLDSYAQKNRFRYKYNDDNARYNDGVITIENVNLPDEKSVIESAFHSPEKNKVSIFNFESNVYKFWNKEVNDDGTIKYSELDNRFYLMRSDNHNFGGTIKIGSELLNTFQTVSSCKIESFSRLRFQDIIDDYYQPIQTILNKSKLHTVQLYLSSIEVSQFDFKKLVFIDSLGGYFLVNKIHNYIPNQLTNVELIKVEYEPTSSTLPTVPNTATYLTVNSVTVSGCSIVVQYSTDATIGTPIKLEVKPNDFGIPSPLPTDPIYLFNQTVLNTGVTNTIEFNLEDGTFYQLQLKIDETVTANIYSNIEYFENSTSCTISSPSTLTITGVTYLGDEFLSKRYRIDFTTDAVLPRTIYYADYKSPSGFFGGWSNYQGVTSSINNIEILVSSLFGTPEKLRIKIGDTVSNEYTIT